MSERRMFARAIVESDAFLALPVHAQLLYFHMCMGADDDGVCGSMRMAMVAAQATDNDLGALETARFVLKVGAVYVIKHWRMMNTIRKDRYRPSSYRDELEELTLKPDGSYTFANAENMGKTWLP